VVLDDCLSAVDAQTEHTILQNMEEALAGKTAIVITHRVFALQDFDNILVMHHGKIVEQGKHDILLNQKGMYAQMYEEQMKQHQE
jgi:ATP-binding cassette subfamily B protein